MYYDRLILTAQIKAKVDTFRTMYKVEITSIIKGNYPDRYLFLTMIKDGKKSVKVFNTKEFY